MSAQKKPPLSVARPHSNDTEPFAGDLFERRGIADRLTELLDQLPDGGVIAIDAGWGEGKSWFARNWNADLRKRGFPTIYLDAFEADYVEDPFLLIAAELLTVMEQDSHTGIENFREGTRKVAAVVMPVIAKATVRAISLALTGLDLSKGVDAVVDGATESVTDDAGSLISEAIKARIQELRSRRQSVDGFRQSLTEALGTNERPLVFLIDELDRCKPPFAVQLLERIKHFFTVPKVIFVLLLNKRQLEASVRGLYGSDIDSNTYLAKFVTLSLTLPAKLSEENRRSEFAMRFCLELGRRLNHLDRRGFGDFCEALSSLAPLFGMSFREIERAFAYYGLAGTAETTAALVAYLSALKVARPGLFAGLLMGDGGATHKAIYEFLDEVKPGGDLPWIFRVVRAAHSSIFRNESMPADEKSDLDQFRQAFSDCRGAADTFAYWARKLDLQIS